jgi:hypothetical protein
MSAFVRLHGRSVSGRVVGVGSLFESGDALDSKGRHLNVPDRATVFGRNVRTLSREPKLPQPSPPGWLARFGGAFPAVPGGDRGATTEIGMENATSH